jgi:hypothetical protein
VKARVLIAIVAASTLLCGADALAQSKQECADAYTAAQVARRDNKLKDARDKLVVCAKSSCPAALRKDCTPWLAEVEADLPTISVKPVDETGRVVENATIAVDGASVTRDGDLATLRVDPGEHVVRVEAEGMQAAEQKISVVAGASKRELTLRLTRVASSSSPPPPAASSEPSRPVPVLTFVLAGVGVAGVATFAALGAAGKSKKSALDQQGCKPNCSSSTVSAIKTDYNAADVALGVGGVALVGALVVFLTRSTTEEAKPVSEASWTLVPARGGGSLIVRF